MVRGWSGSQLGSTRMDWVTVVLLASVRGDDGTAITSSFALCDFEAIVHNLKHEKQHLGKVRSFNRGIDYIVGVL